VNDRTQPDPEVLLRLEGQMRIAGQRMRRAVHARAVAVHPSLSIVAYGALEALLHGGPCRQADLVCTLGADKGAVSRGVQQLIDLGFAERLADPSDGRAHRVAPTEEGQARMEAVSDVRRASYAERLAGWSDAELDELVALMTRYNDDLEPS
jgi:DNA-binding MarR family transcriptional regulator